MDVLRQFEDLHDRLMRVAAGENHPMFFQRRDVARVDFVTMTEAQADAPGILEQPGRQSARDNIDILAPQPHVSAQTFDLFLLGQDIDDGVLAIGVEQGAVVRYTLYDRGGAVDEYASLPEYSGPLPPGYVVALGANPTVVSRLTGADPARVRQVARTAASPADLPPALELLEQIAGVLGVAGANHGWEG